MSTQSIYNKTKENYKKTTDLINMRLARVEIIKQEYLPNSKGACLNDFYNINKMTELLDNPLCEFQEHQEKIKSILNTFQLKYKELNQF